MKIFLAGRRPSLQHGVSVHQAETARLRALGFEVVNQVLFDFDSGATWEDFMLIDIQQLVTCHTVALLDCWTASKEARLAHRIALDLRMSPRLAAFFVSPAPTSSPNTAPPAIAQQIPLATTGDRP